MREQELYDTALNSWVILRHVGDHQEAMLEEVTFN